MNECTVFLSACETFIPCHKVTKKIEDSNCSISRSLDFKIIIVEIVRFWCKMKQISQKKMECRKSLQLHGQLIFNKDTREKV